MHGDHHRARQHLHVHSVERVWQIHHNRISGAVLGLTWLSACLTVCLQDNMCGLWKLESDETKSAPLICFLQSITVILVIYFFCLHMLLITEIIHLPSFMLLKVLSPKRLKIVVGIAVGYVIIRLIFIPSKYYLLFRSKIALVNRSS